MKCRSLSYTERAYEKLIERFCDWAKDRSDIRAAVIVGSRARADHPADEWADLDIVTVTTNPEHYVLTSDWVNNFGKPLLTFIEPTSNGEEKERRVLFDGMLDVDFAIMPKERVRKLLQAGGDPRTAAQISNSLGRGVRVLVDKDGLAEQIRTLAAPANMIFPHHPKQDEFLHVVNDFLYHAVFVAKHLRRGELWWTVTCLDCYMQRLLLTMIEWHALATHGWKYDTWFRGRFLEEWAEPETVKMLSEAFAHCDEEDVKHALMVTMDLFRRLANETASKLSFPYPAKEDRKVTGWIEKCLSQPAE